jgi:DNA-directed RNA polymerase subunit beta'
LIPAGTGFRIFQDSEVSYRREALEDLVNRGTAAAEESFPLLNQAPKPADEPVVSNPSVVRPAVPSLEDLITPPSEESPTSEPASAPDSITESRATPEE